MFELIDSEGFSETEKPECSLTRAPGLPSLEVVLENGRRIGVQPQFDRRVLLELIETLESLPLGSVKRL